MPDINTLRTLVSSDHNVLRPLPSSDYNPSASSSQPASLPSTTPGTWNNNATANTMTNPHHHRRRRSSDVSSTFSLPTSDGGAPIPVWRPTPRPLTASELSAQMEKEQETSMLTRGPTHLRSASSSTSDTSLDPVPAMPYHYYNGYYGGYHNSTVSGGGRPNGSVLSRQNSRSSTTSHSTVFTTAATAATSGLSRQNSTGSMSSRSGGVGSTLVVAGQEEASVSATGDPRRELERVRRENEILRLRIRELERELRRVNDGREGNGRHSAS